MISLDELQEIDIQDPMVWPPWFTWLMGVVAAVALVGAGWYFVLQDQQDVLVAKQREETTLTETYRSKAALVASLPAWEKQMEQVKKMLAEMEYALPDSQAMASLLTDITNAVLSQGLTITLFQPRDEVPYGVYAMVPIDIQVMGAFHQVAEFVSTISAMNRIVTVRNLSMTRTGGDDAEGQLTASASLVTYRYVGAEGAKQDKSG
jgi:type IV pilus assembly protein PilO